MAGLMVSLVTSLPIGKAGRNADGVAVLGAMPRQVLRNLTVHLVLLSIDLELIN